MKDRSGPISGAVALTNKKGKIMNYVYIRYSTDHQDERQQMNDIRKYLAAKGLTVDRIERDEGVSGGKSYKDRRLLDLVSEMKEGDCLIVSEISRLGRSMGDLNKLITDELKPRKVRLIALKMNLDLDCSKMRAADELLLMSFAFAAQLERELIIDRTRSGLEARQRAGIKIGGTKALWGKNTGTNRNEAMSKMRAAAAEARRKKSQENPNIKSFLYFVGDWKKIHGKIRDWKTISDTLNERGVKTPTGLPFTDVRARALYNRITKEIVA